MNKNWDKRILIIEKSELSYKFLSEICISSDFFLASITRIETAYRNQLPKSRTKRSSVLGLHSIRNH